MGVSLTSSLVRCLELGGHATVDEDDDDVVSVTCDSIVDGGNGVIVTWELLATLSLRCPVASFHVNCSFSNFNIVCLF